MLWELQDELHYKIRRSKETSYDKSRVKTTVKATVKATPEAAMGVTRQATILSAIEDINTSYSARGTSYMPQYNTKGNKLQA